MGRKDERPGNLKPADDRFDMELRIAAGRTFNLARALTRRRMPTGYGEKENRNGSINDILHHSSQRLNTLRPPASFPLRSVRLKGFQTQRTQSYSQRTQRDFLP